MQRKPQKTAAGHIYRRVAVYNVDIRAVGDEADDGGEGGVIGGVYRAGYIAVGNGGAPLFIICIGVVYRARITGYKAADKYILAINRNVFKAEVGYLGVFGPAEQAGVLVRSGAFRTADGEVIYDMSAPLEFALKFVAFAGGGPLIAAHVQLGV